MAEKIRLLHESFPSQREKHWYDDELFRALMRIRGMEGAAWTSGAATFTGAHITLSANAGVRKDVSISESMR